ncbi:hypothetical protein LMG23992_01469 [Cupriavidus laharis]|uniref:LysM domain-containing protein n=1 Tax=Cupriavidus laharis TaxID=151654 RepID=A0ABM8WRN4_9BURK|nr:hypothetical protein [Cupriavidus laharis]CAG9170119.1 hypothetical protein LMG23992_01469 [Cupriavidus laharis]
MRVLVIKQASDLQALATRLTGTKTTGSATLERVQALNPHVDFNRIEPGTVLLLPDAPDLKAPDKDTHTLDGDTFEVLVKQTADGFKAASARLREATESFAADRSAVASVVKTAAVKRLIESDPLLKKQLDAAGEEAGAEQKRMQEAAKHLETLEKVASDAWQELGKLLR